MQNLEKGQLVQTQNGHKKLIKALSYLDMAKTLITVFHEEHPGLKPIVGKDVLKAERLINKTADLVGNVSGVYFVTQYFYDEVEQAQEGVVYE